MSQQELFNNVCELPPLPYVPRGGAPLTPKVIELARKLSDAKTPEEREDIMADYDPIQSDVPVQRGTLALNTTKTYAREWTLKDMQREFLQNLLDETIRKNGRGSPSFRGVRIVSGVRRNGRRDEEVTILYNQEHRLAEVVFTPSQTETKCSLRFINYGSKPRGGRNMLRYGQTSKRGRSNQIGKYGEGAKRSIAICVNHGITVDILAYVKETTHFTCQHWVFKDLGKDDVLGSVTPIRPSSYYEHSEDEFRFEVKLLASKSLSEQLRFTLNDFLVPREFMVDEEEMEGGVVLPAEEHAGDLYAHHFFVTSTSRAAFGYDFFATPHRDRNSFASRTLYRLIASAWSTAIEKRLPVVEERLMAYLDDSDVHYKRDHELHALKYLSAAAKEHLAMLWRRRHPERYPETGDRQAACLTLEGKRVPEQLYRALVFSTDCEWMRASERFPSPELMATTMITVETPPQLAPIVQLFLPLRITFFATDFPLKYHASTNGGGALFLNVACYVEATKLEFFTELLCKLIPAFYPDFDALPTMQRYVDMTAAVPLVETEDEEQDDGAAPPPIVIDDDDSDAAALPPQAVEPLRVRVKRPIMEQWVDGPDNKRIKLQWFAPSADE